MVRVSVNETFTFTVEMAGISREARLVKRGASMSFMVVRMCLGERRIGDIWVECGL